MLAVRLLVLVAMLNEQLPVTSVVPLYTLKVPPAPAQSVTTPSLSAGTLCDSLVRKVDTPTPCFTLVIVMSSENAMPLYGWPGSATV